MLDEETVSPAERLARAMALGIAIAALVWSSASASAQSGPFVHTVRPGETLASIAQRYYGDPRKESILVAENGLNAQGGAAIVVGLRLIIPFVTYHRVADGETWAMLAERFYGSADRAFLLIEENEGTAGDQPDVGAELMIPYPLRYTSEQSDNLRRIGMIYYRSDGPDAIRKLRRFNGMRGIRPNRGQVVLVPLSNLTLSDEGREIVAGASPVAATGGETRELQQRIDEEMPRLREHIRRGRYTEAVSLGNRLLGSGRLTGNQIVSIQRELATAYVALNRADLAVQAFRTALRRQRDLELDVTRTSPVVLRALEEARARERNEPPPRPPDGGVPDAGR
jgi:hypothetical protein